ncbi:MAG: DEAD/DEAH box helicase [Phycisphaerae bacterium]|nr:DEAD/DEAH box helicase [Phycisphaerae bacterium]
MQFEDLRLGEPLLRAVRTARYVHPTPIQALAIPPILAGRDVLGCAQTGTGKTAAYALPILQRLSERAVRTTAPPGRIRVLVLCPTRELAQQIHDSFGVYGRHAGVQRAVVFGGVNQGPQARAIRAGVDILTATPGRLLDLMGQGLASVAETEILVLDEADRMLDMGFLPDLRRILAHIPRQRQTLLFSATMPPPIRKLAGDILQDAVVLQVERESSPAPSVAHWVYHVEKPEKPGLLLRLLAEKRDTRTLVFTRTKYGADKVVRQLVRTGVPAAALHGNKSQGARTRALAEFRAGRTPVLVATDIAARGLDVDNISRVINYDLTPTPETYVHRIGRAGRAGAAGIALSFCTSEDHGDLQAIERLICEPLRRAVDLPRNGIDGSRLIRVANPKAIQPRRRRPRPKRSPQKRAAPQTAHG